MMTRIVCSTLLILFSTSLVLSAEDSFESQVLNLADYKYSKRIAAIQSLIDMCKEKPELLDALLPVALSQKGEVERVMNARKVVRTVVMETQFVERGAIGFALDQHFAIFKLVKDGPAEQSGIEISWKLLSVGDKSVKGMAAADVYAMVHATKPGTELEMKFQKQDGGNVLVRPVVAPRNTIRHDEKLEERKQKFFEDWLNHKCDLLELKMPGSD